MVMAESWAAGVDRQPVAAETRTLLVQIGRVSVTKCLKARGSELLAELAACYGIVDLLFCSNGPVSAS